MIVTTESGSRYEIDLDNYTFTRAPTCCAAACEHDADVVKFSTVYVKVGEPMRILHTNDTKLRVTTPVVDVEQEGNTNGPL